MVGELADSNTVKLARYFEENYIQNMIGQHALWAYTDEADFKDLEKYGADSLTIELTKKILNDLLIQTTLNTEVTEEVASDNTIKTTLNTEVTEEVASDNTIKVNKYIIYGTGGLIIILLTTTIFLSFRRRKNDDINA
jgi:hypothetical protein